jgi:endo-1,4-beta-mannosidase
MGLASEPPPPLETCTPAQVETARNLLPPYEPANSGAFVTLRDGQFFGGDAVYHAAGVNYYPSRYPWRRFLTESTRDAIVRELDLLEDAGFNTLRVFLWNEALFACPGSGAVPVPAAFGRLERFIHDATARGFRLIVTLNDLPDLAAYPLYTNPPHLQAQTAFIIERYRDEAAILAWDLRNEGDIDYGSNNPLNAKFPREQVLGWLAESAAQVRALNPPQLITAGWYLDAEATADAVDFVSFHHWGDAANLRERIATMRAATDKPLLLQEFGYSTQRISPDDQRRVIGEVVEVASEADLLGWLVWTAFDFPTDATCVRPSCPSPDNAEHYFGLWTADYAPKPAAELLTMLLGS